MGSPGKHGVLSVGRTCLSSCDPEVMGAQFYDANISIPGCDKNMPGCIMAMARVNRPAVRSVVRGVCTESNYFLVRVVFKCVFKVVRGVVKGVLVSS